VTITASALHESAIIIDAVCPLLRDPSHLDEYIRGGVTVIAPTVNTTANAATALRAAGMWHRIIRERQDLMLVRSAADVRAAKAQGRTGVVLHFQGSDAIEDDIDLVDAWKAIGVGIIQLAYNTKNRIGTGCEEDADSGLSRFGRKVIARMNDCRVIIDCSHTGPRTTRDAIDCSTAPVVISHANPRAVHDSPRNIDDDLMRRIAANGGNVGVVGYPAFVSASARPTLDQFIDHVAYMCDLIGSDHVTLGIDYFEGQSPYMEDTRARAMYDALLHSGDWSEKSYPPPPWHYPAGIETPATLHNLTEGLLARGFAEADIRRIYGENWLRIYRTVWGE